MALPIVAQAQITDGSAHCGPTLEFIQTSTNCTPAQQLVATLSWCLLLIILNVLLVFFLNQLSLSLLVSLALPLAPSCFFLKKKKSA